MKEFCGKIYQIKNLINGKSYIGQTKLGLCFRFCSPIIGHWTKAFKENNDKYLYNSIRKYGKENFDIIILEDNIATKEQLNEREIYYIKELNTLYPNGYNISHGGDWGDVFTNNPRKEEIRLKHKKYGKDNGFYGKTHSSLFKIKMSKLKKGVPLSQCHKNNISNSMSKKIWINNTICNKRIYYYELYIYLQNNWQLGRIYKNNPFKDNRVWINNGINNKFIKFDDVNNYLMDGFKLGKIKKVK